MSGVLPTASSTDERRRERVKRMLIGDPDSKRQNGAYLRKFAPSARRQAARAVMAKERGMRERHGLTIGQQRDLPDARAMQIQELGQAAVTAAHFERRAGEPGLAFDSDLGEADLAPERVLFAHQPPAMA